ncbi:SAM-dependent methyltransferase [Saccharopolyspora erythraea]|nr:SAM-dependent methyltransferase [Saccharopolyspora erythraea]
MPAEFHVLDEALGYFYSAALRAAANLNIADHLAEFAQTPDELAVRLEADSSSVYRLLRYLATRGIFAEDDAGKFHLTPSAEPLRTDVPNSMREAVLMLTHNFFWEPAAVLDETVRVGSTQFERIFRSPFFDLLARDEHAGQVFHEGMASMSDSENRQIADSYDFSSVGELVDVGGGHGGFLIEVLRKWPHVHGVLFDEEHVLRDHRLKEAEVAERSETRAGDFFESVPSGADGYVLKRILHDWDDEACVRILSHCRQAMSSQGRVLVIDAVIPPGNEPHPGKPLDILLMTSLHGKERTESEFRKVFEAAGLTLTRVIPTGTPLSIVEGTAE